MTPLHRRRLARLARTHHGVVTREELHRIGLTAHAIEWALHTHVLTRLFAGVYRVNGAPDTWKGRALAAQRRVERQLRRKDGPETTPPVVAIGEAAAAHLHGLPGYRRPQQLVVVTSQRCRSTQVTTRERRSLALLDVVEINRIPAVSLAWNAVELAGLVSPRKRDDLFAHLLSTGRLTPGRLLGAAHRAYGVPGRAAAIEAARSVHDVQRSSAEGVFHKAFLEVGLDPAVNLVVRTSGGVDPECDFAFVDDQVDVELDGPHHLLPSQRARDRRRDRDLRQDGWDVHRFPVEEVDEDPLDVARRVKAIIDERRALAAGSEVGAVPPR